MQVWPENHGIYLIDIQPGKPAKHTYIGRSNCRFAHIQKKFKIQTCFTILDLYTKWDSNDMFKTKVQSSIIKGYQTLFFPITDESYIGAVRRQAVMLAQMQGFLLLEIDIIAIIINEQCHYSH